MSIELAAKYLKQSRGWALKILKAYDKSAELSENVKKGIHVSHDTVSCTKRKQFSLRNTTQKPLLKLSNKKTWIAIGQE